MRTHLSVIRVLQQFSQMVEGINSTQRSNPFLRKRQKRLKRVRKRLINRKAGARERSNKKAKVNKMLEQ